MSNDNHSRKTPPLNKMNSTIKTVTNNLSAGCVSFFDLPEDYQNKLYNQQIGSDNIFRVTVESEVRSVICLFLIIICFFGIAIYTIDSEITQTIKLLLALCCLLLGFFFAFFINRLIKFNSSIIKPFLYLTPLYFIKTDFDVICFWPVHSLKKVTVINHVSFLSFNYALIKLQFEKDTEIFRFNSKKRRDEFLQHLEGIRNHNFKKLVDGFDNTNLLNSIDMFKDIPKTVYSKSGCVNGRLYNYLANLDIEVLFSIRRPVESRVLDNQLSFFIYLGSILISILYIYAFIISTATGKIIINFINKVH